MKWTTTKARASATHWVGFAQKERHPVGCSSLCKVLEGGVVLHYQDSGAVHNPPPSTERGRRRAAKRR
jgi:hypothetical protein